MLSAHRMLRSSWERKMKNWEWGMAHLSTLQLIQSVVGAADLQLPLAQAIMVNGQMLWKL